LGGLDSEKRLLDDSVILGLKETQKYPTRG
jgi:hypothetical protein